MSTLYMISNYVLNFFFFLHVMSKCVSDKKNEYFICLDEYDKLSINQVHLSHFLSQDPILQH